MKIAIFTDAFYPQINGVVTSINSIATNMVKRGHEVVIVAPGYKDLKEFESPGIRVIRVKSVSASFYDDFKWTNPFSYTTYKAVRDENIDIVHFMTPIFISLVGIKIARMLNVPLVGTFHTFIANPLYFEHLFKGPLKVSEDVAWRYLNLYYDCADYVTAPTEEAVKIIKSKGCNAPLETISNGIDFDIFDNRKSQEFKEKFNLGNKVALYIGRVAYEKNLHTLIDAFDMLYENCPDAQLLIVGDGPQKEEFESYAAQKECSSGVIFTGAIAHKELVHSGIFKAVSLFATASETETQGITILEAQANGLITVAVREGGVIDLIEDGVNGYLVDAGDSKSFAEKMLHILENQNELNTMTEAALKMVDVHRMSCIIDRWEELYQDLIQKNVSGKLLEKDYLHFKDLLSFIKTFRIDFQYFLKKIRPRRSSILPRISGGSGRILRKFRLH